VDDRIRHEFQLLWKNTGALNKSSADFSAIMLLSLFDNLLAPKPVVKEEIPIQQEFEITVKGENIPVRIQFEQRFNNRATVNKNGILIRISDRQQREEQ